MDDRNLSEEAYTMEQDPVVEVKQRLSPARVLAKVFWGILAIMFALGFIFNVYVIINRVINKDRFPSAFGMTPIVVAPPPEGESYVDDVIRAGDLLIAVEKNYEDYEFGEMIAFTYRDYLLVGTIEDTEIAHGLSSFVVQSVTDDTVYDPTAKPENTRGAIEARIPLLGYFFLFLTTLWGRILFVGVPLLIYVILFFVGANDDLFDELPPEVEPVPQRRRPAPDYVPTPGERALSFATTLVLTMAAIAYGTSDARRQKRRLAKEAKLARKQAPYAMAAEVCRPVRMRAVHAVTSVRRRSVRSVKPVRRRASRLVTPISARPMSQSDSSNGL